MDSGHRWLGVGHGSGPDARTAGRDAAAAACRGDAPALMIVFTAGVHDPDELLAGIEEACPGVPLIGCSSELVVTPAGREGHGVVVTTIGGPGFTARTAAGDCAAGDERAGGTAAAQCVADLDADLDADAADADARTAPAAGQRVLVMLLDGTVGEHEEVLAGAYGVVGASLPMIGGCAGADDALGSPYQLHGREVLRGAAVGAVIASDGPLGFGVGHGCRAIGEPMIVTRSVKGDVHTLDDRPALTAYLDRYAAPRSAYTDPRTFTSFAQSRPIGIRRRHGVEVRSVTSAAGLSAGELRASGEVPEGGLIWPMEGDPALALEAAGRACRDAVYGLGGVPPLGLLAFDCVSRFHMLGADGIRQEVARMVGQSRDAPVTGFYTWGEILRTRGLNGYHNQTLAVLAMG